MKATREETLEEMVVRLQKKLASYLASRDGRGEPTQIDYMAADVIMRAHITSVVLLNTGLMSRQEWEDKSRSDLAHALSDGGVSEAESRKDITWPTQ